MIVDIEDPADPRLAGYTALRESTLRRSEDVFVAEGELVVRRAVEAGYVPVSFLLAPRWVDELAGVWGRFDVPVYRAEFAVIEQITGFHVHRGVLALMRRGRPASFGDVVGPADRVVVVQDLVDHSNLGTIARTTAALGWDALVVSERSADPLYRRAVKASMGVVLSLPWCRSQDDSALVPELRRRGFWVVALALSPEAVRLQEVDVRAPRVALLLGTEGAGLSEDWIAAADVVARIDMAAGVDSLNVGAAAAIACWELRRG